MNFKEELKKLNIEITENQLSKFDLYYQRLIEVNQVMNLTAITEKNEVYIKHFFDSLTLTECLENKNITLCDVGSGAGFPSLPLAILFPEMEITIVDALNKRINFLNQLISELELPNAVAIHARAEDFAKTKRENFDIVCARAVANLPMLSELCLPLVKMNGYFLAMKGSNAAEEVEMANHAITILGGKLKECVSLKLPYEMGERTILRIEKIVKTPLKYPRIFKLIKENPL